MAFTSPKMSLRIWNLLTDLYDHTQLADNWAKVDYHDHSPGKGVQIPTEGLADGAVTGPKLAAALDPSGAYTAIKTVATAGGFSPTAAAANTWVLRTTPENTAVTTVPLQARPAWFYSDPDWWTASGRVVTFQLHARILTNAVAPTATYTFGLYPIATWGGASGVEPTIVTLGTVVPGSTVAIAAPPAAAPTAASVTFAAPAAGNYVIACVQTGAGAAGSIVTFGAHLGARAV